MTGDAPPVADEGDDAAALARLHEATRSPALVLVRRDDIAAVIALLGRVADELDVLRQMRRRS